jgi:Zn-dependent protease with chaperone function
LPKLTIVGKPERIDGYAEWVRENYLIVDGQRVRWSNETKLRLGQIQAASAIPLGYEITVQGVRLSDGTFLAGELEGKPNGLALYEQDLVAQFNRVEENWVIEGAMFVSGRGTRQSVGRVQEDGPDVARVREVMNRLLPPYVSPGQIRVRVVDSDLWNASAMANGAIWVYRGLLKDVSDDELAIVLGHELAHYTHEHSRRTAKNDMWRQLAAAGAAGALRQMNSGTARDSLTVGAQLALSAWGNGYSRNLEDQADRVGLRYAHEAGFDVSAGPQMWSRQRAESGEADRLTNWFGGSHSRPSDRIKNIRREISLNYAPK